MQTKSFSIGKGSGQLPFQIGQVELLQADGYVLAPIRDASTAAKEFCQEFNAIADGDEEAMNKALRDVKPAILDEVYTQVVVSSDKGKQFRTIDAGFTSTPQYFTCVEGNKYSDAKGVERVGKALRIATPAEVKAAGYATA